MPRWNFLDHHSTIVFRGLRRVLNWSPIMPRDASLSCVMCHTRCYCASHEMLMHFFSILFIVSHTHMEAKCVQNTGLRRKQKNKYRFAASSSNTIGTCFYMCFILCVFFLQEGIIYGTQSLHAWDILLHLFGYSLLNDRFYCIKVT